MTGAQHQKYFWEWGRCRDFYRSKGLSAAQADAKRHELHVKALGRDKSSKSFTNAELDKVLAAFRSIFDASSLDAQMDIQEQPERRRAAMEARIMKAGRAFLQGNDNSHTEWKIINYVGGICAKLSIERRWPMLDEQAMAKVMGIMERRAAQVARKSVNVPAREEDDGNPF